MAKPALVDLHTHTDASDGLCAPAELIRRARGKDLVAVAVTDHDTAAGVAAACEAAAGTPLIVVPGVELSCVVEDGAGRSLKVHLLGLFIRHMDDEGLFDELARRRRERMARMLARLDALGMPPVEIPDRPGAAVLGRPHLARAMVARGLVGSVGEAFARYLRDGGPLDEPKFRLPLAEGVGHIHRMGGLALVAHPSLGEDGPLLEAWLSGVWPEGEGRGPFGMDGVEAYHPKHSGEQTARWLRFARARDAAVSGGSDFHDPDGVADLGVPPVPADIYEDLLRRYRS